MGSLEDALHQNHPLGVSTPSQIRTEILAPSAPPQITKDGPKPATKKMVAAASARKEIFLRAVIDARRLRKYNVDWLVQPLCLGVFRREGSTAEQTRLAFEILREVGAYAPADEPVLAETIRLGIAERKVTGLRASACLGSNDPPATSIGGGSSQRTRNHFRILALAPPRIGAVVLWRECERVVKLVSNENGNVSETETATRVAAIVACGACLSRLDGIERLVQYAPQNADATGARGAGALFAVELWRRIAVVAEDAGAPDPVVAVAFNALALLLGPALGDAHPTVPRMLAAHARDPDAHGTYTGPVLTLGGEIGASAVSAQTDWRGDGGCAMSSADGDGVVARGVATPTCGDDPSGALSPTLAAVRLDVTMRIVARAKNLAQRATRLPQNDKAIAAGALVTALCAALEHATGGGFRETSSGSTSLSPVTSPTKQTKPNPLSSSHVSHVSELSRLRDAARARRFDDAGGVVRLAEDGDGARDELYKLAAAGADYVGEALLRPLASQNGPHRGRGIDPICALAGGAGLLALSGCLPKQSMPLDWVQTGSSALFSVVASNAVPELNDDAQIAARVTLDAVVAREAFDGKGKTKKQSVAPVVTSKTTLPEIGHLHLGDDTNTTTKTEKETAKKPGKELPRETPRLPRRAGGAIAPLSCASFLLAVADALPSMPISQPLRAIRVLVTECKRGLPNARDARVAITARALTTHASLRTHPEAIVVMTPLGEIIGGLMVDDCVIRVAAERAVFAAERAAKACVIDPDLTNDSTFGTNNGTAVSSSSKASKKMQQAGDTARAVHRLYRDAARAVANARAPQFREELAVCAVEAVLRLRPGLKHGFAHEKEKQAERNAGWCQVALEAAATLRRAALWPTSATGGRRAACDSATRLIAHLCAATRVAVAEAKRPEAPGVHAAAQRVLAALVQETVLAQKSGLADDAASASVAYVACAHLDFPNENFPDDSGDENLSRARERAAGSKGGPHGPVVIEMVEALVSGGAAFRARRVQNAAAQRTAGSMFGKTGSNDTSSELSHVSPEATCAVGLACVELLGNRCPSLSPTLSALLEGALRSGGFEESAGPALTSRARHLAQRLRNASLANAGNSLIPDSFSDSASRPTLVPPPVMLAHLLSSDGTSSARRYVSGETVLATREAGNSAAAQSADFATLVSARNGAEAATLSVARADRRDRNLGPKNDTPLNTVATPRYSLETGLKTQNLSSGPTPLTGPCDPVWIEGSHVAFPQTRTARVVFRCVAPPASNEAGASGASGLAGTLVVGTHGPCVFANGAASVVLELGGDSAKAKAASRARDVVGVPGVGADGGAGFASVPGNAGHVGQTVSRSGVGVDEECFVEIEVRVGGFGQVALRPVVTYPTPQSGTENQNGQTNQHGDAQPALRCFAYKIPPSHLLRADGSLRRKPNEFDALWCSTPFSFEFGCTVDLCAARREGYCLPEPSSASRVLDAPDRQRAVLLVAVAAMSAEETTETETGSGFKKNPRAAPARNRATPFAKCGGYALGPSLAACERFAAVTWNGEHLLCVLFASSAGVRLEYRARSAATLAPIAADPEAWLLEIAGKALVVADFDRDAENDATLFQPPATVTPETLANGDPDGNGVKLLEAAAREWKAMSVA